MRSNINFDAVLEKKINLCVAPDDPLEEGRG